MKKYIVLIALLCVTNTVNSALVTYNQYNTWSTTLGTVVNEDFSSASANIALDAAPTIFQQLTLTSFSSGSYSNAQIKSGYSSSTLDINGFLSGDYVEALLPQPVAGVGFYYFPGDATNDRLNVYVNGAFVASLYNNLFGTPRFFGVTDNAGSSINSISFVSANSGMYTEIDSISWSASPVPIPAAAWLFSSGLILLAAFRRNRGQADFTM